MRHGDVLSPKLVIIVVEYSFKHLGWESKGINIDGQKLNNLCCANDIVLIVEDLEEVRHIRGRRQRKSDGNTRSLTTTCSLEGWIEGKLWKN